MRELGEKRRFWGLDKIFPKRELGGGWAGDSRIATGVGVGDEIDVGITVRPTRKPHGEVSVVG